MSATNIGEWNGKTLVLDMSKLNTDVFTKNSKIPGGDDSEKNDDSMKELVKMFQMTFSNTIKFDQKIKSITGKHDWISQKDDHTLLLSVNLSQLADHDLKLKNKDSKITITTE